MLTGKGEKAYSFAEALKEYEEWVGEVSDKIPPIRCKEQQVLMSNYHWETDKIENAPTTLGDGGDIEEVRLIYFRQGMPVLQDWKHSDTSGAQYLPTRGCYCFHTNTWPFP